MLVQGANQRVLQDVTSLLRSSVPRIQGLAAGIIRVIVVEQSAVQVK